MKKIAAFFLLVCAQMIFAQGTRFIYQVTMKSDSTNREQPKTELAYLDIANGKSVFYGENRVKRDSIISRARQTKNFNFDRSQMQGLRSNLDFFVDKDLKAGITTFKSRLLRDQYSYEEDRTMNWKILSETAKIGDYKTQKAETQFAGRTWYAWFTSDVPIQDGPYKFSGLPGLIVKVEDAKGDYSFDLKESKKISELPTFEERGTIIKIKRAVFEKQQAQYLKDPFAALQGSSDRGGWRMQMDPNQRKQMEDRFKAEIAKNNNPIELK